MSHYGVVIITIMGPTPVPRACSCLGGQQSTSIMIPQSPAAAAAWEPDGAHRKPAPREPHRWCFNLIQLKW